MYRITGFTVNDFQIFYSKHNHVPHSASLHLLVEVGHASKMEPAASIRLKTKMCTRVAAPSLNCRDHQTRTDQ
jgi:hypothetical protein